jgi:hypothetical protein
MPYSTANVSAVSIMLEMTPKRVSGGERGELLGRYRAQRAAERADRRTQRADNDGSSHVGRSPRGVS